MRTHMSRVRAALVVLLVGSGILFLVGSTIERNHRHHESGAAKSTETSGGEPGSGTESGGEGTTPAEKHAASSSGEAGAKLLGVNTESVALSVVAVVVSFLLAGAIWLLPSNLVFLAIALFALVFSAGDARELVHQLDDSNGGLATVAGLLLFLHLGITALAASRLPRRGRERTLPG
jgi:hypothetical protein